jgi:hypothetical protein
MLHVLIICPVCETPIDYTVKQKIDIIPVEIA